jgi:pyruvate formate-lyase activating enzyme-like uncharacterized protein
MSPPSIDDLESKVDALVTLVSQQQRDFLDLVNLEYNNIKAIQARITSSKEQLASALLKAKTLQDKYFDNALLRSSPS